MTEKMINAADKKLISLETKIKNGVEITPDELQLVRNIVDNYVLNQADVADDIKAAYEQRLADVESVAVNYLPQAEEVSDRYVKMPVNTVGKIKKVKKANYALPASIVVASAVLASAIVLKDCGKEAVVEPVAVEAEAPTPVIEQPEEVVKVEVEKVLSESLAFDPNDNHELVNRMVEFIADSLTKGVPVKDVMTEEEIALAEKNDQALITIEQLMDFYMVMNIEDIDPADYARLQYNTKTAETITDNYMYCARIFMTDSLTAKVSDEIDYTKIMAHKDSAEQLQKFVDYLAKYNDSKATAEEIREYIMDQYIEKDANLYSMSANELTYRLMFDADLISNNSILPKDMNIILNEDGKITCDTVKDDGVKNKTEKAEEFTSIYNTVDEKLIAARDFRDQDLTNIDEYELKTGVELEEEIKDSVLALNVRYNLNTKFSFAGDINVKPSKGGKGTGYITGVSPSTGKVVNVSAAELAKYGATNLAEYEAAKKAEFEAKAKADPNHTIKNNDGKVVVSGSEVDVAQYNSGYAAGYSDGNNKRSSNPGSSNASYVAGYNEGYAKGLADRNALDASYSKKIETYFEDTTDKAVNTTETVEEKPYTPGPVPVEPTPVDPTPVNPTPVDPTPAPSEPVVEFVPVDETVETEETIEVIDYVSSLKSMRDMLIASTNVDTNKIMKM